jgi:hypothetical protein
MIVSVFRHLAFATTSLVFQSEEVHLSQDKLNQDQEQDPVANYPLAQVKHQPSNKTFNNSPMKNFPRVNSDPQLAVESHLEVVGKEDRVIKEEQDNKDHLYHQQVAKVAIAQQMLIILLT